MTLKIISTEDILFEGEVTAVHLPGQAGRFTVLRNHATLIAALAAGTVGYEGPDGHGELPIQGGMADIDSIVISVCVY